MQAAPLPVLDRLFDDFAGHAAFGSPALCAAAALKAANRNVFVYEVAHESPFFGGAAHAVELPLVFGTFDLPHMELFVGASIPARASLSFRMMRAWANFARSGDPANNRHSASTGDLHKKGVVLPPSWYDWAWSWLGYQPAPTTIGPEIHYPGECKLKKSKAIKEEEILYCTTTKNLIVVCCSIHSICCNKRMASI